MISFAKHTKQWLYDIKYITAKMCNGHFVIGGELSQSKIVYMFRETSYLVFDNKNCYFHFSLKRLFIIFIISSGFLKYVKIILFFDFLCHSNIRLVNWTHIPSNSTFSCIINNYFVSNWNIQFFKLKLIILKIICFLQSRATRAERSMNIAPHQRVISSQHKKTTFGLFQRVLMMQCVNFRTRRFKVVWSWGPVQPSQCYTSNSDCGIQGCLVQGT